MKKLLVLPLLLGIASIFAQQIPLLKWATKSNTIWDDRAYAICNDGQGNVVVSGFNGYGSGDIDVFIGKYATATGALLWSVLEGGTSSDSGYGVTTDAAGNIYATGSFRGLYIFDALNSPDDNDIFVVKYDPIGNLLWARQAGSYVNDYGSDIGVDNAGNVYVTGFFQGTATFGSGTITASAKGDMFLAKYNSTGTLQWVKQASTGYNNYINGLAVSTNGTVTVVGNFYNSATFDNTTLTTGNVSDTLTDAFIARYNTFGNLVWARKGGGATGDDGANDVAIDAAGNLYVTGYFTGTATFGNQTVTSTGGFDIFTAKYNSSGVIQWIRREGGSGFQSGWCISVDNASNSFVSGWFSGAGQFGNFTFNSEGNSDVFIAKYSPDGILQYAHHDGKGTDVCRAHDITSGADDHVYLTGDFYANAKFSNTTLTSSSSTDEALFVVKYKNPTGGTSTNLFPKITVSTFQITAGQTVSFNCSDLTANGNAKLSVTKPDGTVQEINTAANANGSFTYAYNATTIAGTYSVKVKDLVSGNESIVKTFQVAAAPPSTDYLQIFAPTASDVVNTDGNAAAIIAVAYGDQMFLSGNTYPLNGAYRLYQYKIEYSLNNGAWQGASIQSGQALVSQPVTLNFQLSGPVSTGSCRVRVTDQYNPTRQKISAAFIIQIQSATALKVDLEWDYSYGAALFRPIGVAADGVGRVYVKVSKAGANMQSASISITDDQGTTAAAKVGKVMKANVLLAYSFEANTATSTMAINGAADAQGNFWFWYVAPDDFTRNNGDYGARSRDITLNVTATLVGGGIESTTKIIKVVRPPVMFVHGLGGGADTWEAFNLSNDGGLLQDNIRLTDKSVPVLKKFGSFKDNAKQLVSNSASNSFTSLIRSIRRAGYACNQVDYVCHSMGGCMIRYCLSDQINGQTNVLFSDYFDGRSYSKGFAHKIITLDTPHNGSPIADFLVRYQYDIPLTTFGVIKGFYNVLLQPTPAINDLQIDPAPENQGGVNFSATPIGTKAHCLAGKADCDEFGLFYNGSLWTLIYDAYVRESNFLYWIHPYESHIPNCDERRDLLTDLNYGPEFVDASDLIVSTQSQLAGSTEYVTAGNKTIFQNLVHTPGLGFELAGIGGPAPAITNTPIVTDTVLFLLNQDLSSAYFAALPATPNFSGGGDGARSQPPTAKFKTTRVSERGSTDKLSIVSPLENSTILVDQSVTLGVSIIDTVGFIKLNLLFQGALYSTNQLAALINFNVQVNGNLIENQTITAIGYYYMPGGIIEQVVDEVNVYVTTNEPIAAFHAAPLLNFIKQGDSDRPTYTAQFSTFIGELGNSPILTAVIQDPSVLQYNTSDNSFTAIDTGSTYAVLTYKGLKDTIFFVITPELVSGLNEPGSAAWNSGDKNLALVVSPNPSTGFFNVALTTREADEVAIDVLDCYGRTVRTISTGKVTEGTTHYSLDLTDLPDGLYFLRAQDTRSMVCSRIVKAAR